MKRAPVQTIFCGALIVGCLCVSTSILPSHAQSSQSVSTASSTAYGGCPAPSSPGVRICGPFIYPQATSIASPFQLIASGTGAGGPVKAMQVWLDGRKVAQSYGNLFDRPVTASSGTHRLVVVELDTTGAYLKSTPITISVENSTAGEACAPPTSPGVNLCEPGVNSCHTAPWITVIAAGTGASGTVRRMELWSNGSKIANFPGSSINTNLYIFDFNTITVVEVDTNGAYLRSPRILIQAC